MEANEIVEKIRDAKRSKIHNNPCHVVRASEVGHPCERYLVYSITNWQDKSPHDPGLQFVFEGGNLVEELAINDFREAGFKVYRPEPDKGIAEARPAITGHIDFRVDFGDGKVYTGEIKGLNKYDFDSLNCIDDFFNSKKVWLRKYPAQLMTYLYIKGEDRGFFYLKSIPGFQPKIIWVDLDYDYMESILKKTERIEQHVLDKTLPPQIEDYSVCERCNFLHLCLPPCKVKALEFAEDFVAERLDKLSELNESIKPIQEEYDEIYKEIKALALEKEKFIAGKWLVINKKIDKKAFSVAASSYSKVDIQRIADE